MNLYLIHSVWCIIIPLVLSNKHIILVSNNFPYTGCQQINDTAHQCNSIIHLFQLLSTCCNSTDISIVPGKYILTSSYRLTDLHDIEIKSEARAVIQCMANSNGSYDTDTGIGFLRVRNLFISNITIVGCGMKQISTNHIGGGKFIVVRSALLIQNSTNVSLHNVLLSKNNGIGLLIYDTNGLVNITNSSFVNNTLNPLEQSRSFTGGGGIYIEFTECTPGVLSCNSSTNPYSKMTRYIIDQCKFEDNAAIYNLNGSEPEDLASGIFVTFGTGGGLSIWLYGSAQNDSFQVTSSLFTSNRALYGGGLNVHSRQNTRYNYVQVMWCSFIGNVGYVGGGGLALGYVIYQIGGRSLFNNYTIVNCLFKQNLALTGVGGGVVGFGSREPRRTQPTNHFAIFNSTFVSNGAQYGSAIQINKEYFDSIAVGTIFTLVLENCKFMDNNLYENASFYSNSSSIGAIAMSGVNIEFRGSTLFANNNSTALIVDGASVKFANDSVTIFQDNRGLHGGAILLISGAWISIYPDSTIVFLRNQAVEYGGAIYVELSTPFEYILSHVCFVRYYLENISPSEWRTNFTFVNNTAGQNNNTIFANTLKPCLKVYAAEVTNLLYAKPFYYHMNASLIATSPANFKFEFLDGRNITFAIVPGEVFDLPVQLLDELGQSVNSARFIASCREEPSPYIVPTYRFTNGSIQIAGRPNEICHLQLETNTDYQVSTTVEVALLNCPPGFVYKNYKAQCECLVNHTHQNPAISGCELVHFQAYFDQFYWIGYDDNFDLLISPCPYRYCYGDHFSNDQLLPRDANILDKFVCGNRSRTGLLCGQCVEGYSVSLNSPTFTCHKCKNSYLGILYLFLSYIIPVTVLFYIIMAYNIRMTTGPIGAFLFFSQIISSQYRFAFDYSVKANSDETLAASNIVITLYSISNLKFFQHDVFSYCLFPNAGTVDILAFNLLLSFYPVALVFAYFIMRRYCTCRQWRYQWFRLSDKSVTHGVCAFLVLCFAKINVLAFGILKSGDITYVNGANYRKVVYLQGSVKYFGNLLYDIYAMGSLFTIVTIISVPTLILVFHPIMISIARYFHWGESKCVLFINKLLMIHRLKPILDSFQGDYKDNLRFFAGLHSFLYRIIFFCIVIAASTPDVNMLLLLMIAYFITILLIHILVMPFKKYIDNAAYSLTYVLMLTIIIIEHYLFSTGKSLSELIWFEIFLSLLPLTCAVFFCIWKFMISVGLNRRKTRQEIDNSQLDYYHLLEFPNRIINDDSKEEGNIT